MGFDASDDMPPPYSENDPSPPIVRPSPSAPAFQDAEVDVSAGRQSHFPGLGDKLRDIEAAGAEGLLTAKEQATAKQRAIDAFVGSSSLEAGAPEPRPAAATTNKQDSDTPAASNPAAASATPPAATNTMHARGGAGLFLLHDADFLGRNDRTTKEECFSVEQAAELIEKRGAGQHSVCYAWRGGATLVRIPAVGAFQMGKGAKWSSGAELLVYAEDTGHRSHGKMLVALKDVDCCFGDGAIFSKVGSYEAALQKIKEKDNVKQTAYFWHSASSRLIAKPKGRGSNWVGYPNYGWLFLWADARVGDAPAGAAGGGAPAVPMAPISPGGEGVQASGLIGTDDIAGCWICCCFPFCWWALFRKEATGLDSLKHQGCLISPVWCPFEEHRTRVSGTNGFRKNDDHGNVDQYSSKDCVWNGPSCSMKLC